LFIHLGENVVVHSKDIVVILDRQILKSSSIVQEFLDKQRHQVVNLKNGETKSVVVTIDKIFFSPLASNTLKKRAHIIHDIDSFHEENG
jgi:extracellular matrix regulatory protein B